MDKEVIHLNGMRFWEDQVWMDDDGIMFKIEIVRKNKM